MRQLVLIPLAALLGSCGLDDRQAPSVDVAAIEKRTADAHRSNGIGAQGVPIDQVRGYCVGVRDIRTSNPAFKDGDWCDRFDPRNEFATVANLR